jgi:hypothetical protein
MFTDPTTLLAVALLTISTGVFDSLKHAAYPPIGPRKAKPADRKARPSDKKEASWFWSFDSVFNGFILQAGLLAILNPPMLSLAWAGNMATTLVFMMVLHQVVFVLTDRVMFRSGIRKPFPDGRKHLHNFWSSPLFDLHIGNRGLLLCNVAAVMFFIAVEILMKI